MSKSKIYNLKDINEFENGCNKNMIRYDTFKNSKNQENHEIQQLRKQFQTETENWVFKMNRDKFHDKITTQPDQ